MSSSSTSGRHGDQFVAGLHDGDGVQVKNDDVDGIFLVVKDDLGMFITTYFPGEGETAEQFTPQRCREVLTKAFGEPIDIDIIEVAAWRPYERVADQFDCGRAFLVGDSAHTMPPFKAGGANTAIQSAHNLAWKLAAVLQGSGCAGVVGDLPRRASPGGPIRRAPVAHRAVDGAAAGGRRRAAIAGRRRVLDVRPAHRIPVSLGGGRDE